MAINQVKLYDYDDNTNYEEYYSFKDCDQFEQKLARAVCDARTIREEADYGIGYYDAFCEACEALGLERIDEISIYSVDACYEKLDDAEDYEDRLKVSAFTTNAEVVGLNEHVNIDFDVQLIEAYNDEDEFMDEVKDQLNASFPYATNLDDVLDTIRIYVSAQFDAIINS